MNVTEMARRTDPPMRRSDIFNVRGSVNGIVVVPLEGDAVDGSASVRFDIRENIFEQLKGNFKSSKVSIVIESQYNF